ncbi:hypothetical protein ACFL96_15990, partial [Thermoproteota archaeon]
MTSSFFSKKQTRILHVIILLSVAILLRLPTFFLSHNNNDELIHLSLAMKMDRHGLDVFNKTQYNLIYVDKVVDPKAQVVAVIHGKD